MYSFNAGELKNTVFLFSLTPDQGFGAALSLAPFQSASDQYSDVYGKVFFS